MRSAGMVAAALDQYAFIRDAGKAIAKRPSPAAISGREVDITLNNWRKKNNVCRLADTLQGDTQRATQKAHRIKERC